MSDAPDDAPPAPSKTWKTRLRAWGPWLVAGAALLYLFKLVPLDALKAALTRPDPLPFAALLVAYVLGTLASDTFAIWATFRHALPAHAKLSYRETLIIRGASYLLAIVHYGAGQGGLAYFVHRRHKVSLAQAAGAVMLIMGVNAVVVALCAFLGSVAGGLPTDPVLKYLIIAIAAGFPVYLGIIAAKPKVLTRIKLLTPLFDSGLKGHAVAALARFPHMAWLIVCSWLVMRMFGVDPPFARALTLLPIIFSVGVLPISPSGLGTTQAVAVALLSSYALGTPDDQKSAVLAYSLAISFGALLVQVPLGVAFLRVATRAGIVDDTHGSTRR